MVLKGYDSTDGCDGKVDLLVFLEQEASFIETQIFSVSVSMIKIWYRWSIKN